MRIGIGIYKQQPFLENKDHEWRIWVIYNKDVTSGTYLLLRQNSQVDRVTVQDQEIVDIVRISQNL
jgi:hypothetical protein